MQADSPRISHQHCELCIRSQKVWGHTVVRRENPEPLKRVLVCSVGLAHLWKLSFIETFQALKYNVLYMWCRLNIVVWMHIKSNSEVFFSLASLRGRDLKVIVEENKSQEKESFLSEYGKVNRFVCNNKGQSEKRSFFDWKDFFGGVRKVACAVFLTGLNGLSYYGWATFTGVKAHKEGGRLLWRQLSKKRSTSRFIFLLLLIPRPLNMLSH